MKLFKQACWFMGVGWFVMFTFMAVLFIHSNDKSIPLVDGLKLSAFFGVYAGVTFGGLVWLGFRIKLRQFQRIREVREVEQELLRNQAQLRK